MAGAVLDRVVITGGAGLLGSELCRAALAAGARSVVAIDPRAVPPPHPMPPEGPRFFWLRAGVAAQAAASVLADATCVFHLAASTRMRPAGDLFRDVRCGQDVTLSVLEQIRLSPPLRFVFCSSAAVYGRLASRPVAESAGPLLPCSMYGAAKLASEAWVSAQSHLAGFPALICRLGNVISAALDRGALLDILRQAAVSGHIRVLGNGEQARTYIGAEECARALLFLATATSGSGIFNVTGRGLVTTRELVQIVSHTLGRKLDLEVEADGPSGWPGDVPVVNLDTTKLTEHGWLPPCSIEVVRRAASGIAGRVLSERMAAC